MTRDLIKHKPFYFRMLERGHVKRGYILKLANVADSGERT